MIEAKVVTIKELMEDNPTLCMSPLRVFEECHKCPKYQLAEKKGKESQLKCKPRVSKKYLRLKLQRDILLRKLAEVDKKINEL